MTNSIHEGSSYGLSSGKEKSGCARESKIRKNNRNLTILIDAPYDVNIKLLHRSCYKTIVYSCDF